MATEIQIAAQKIDQYWDQFLVDGMTKEAVEWVQEQRAKAHQQLTADYFKSLTQGFVHDHS